MLFFLLHRLSHLVAKAAVVHRGQAVVDGGSSVLVQRLTSRLSLQVTVLQGLHHRLSHLTLNLEKKKTRTEMDGLKFEHM